MQLFPGLRDSPNNNYEGSLHADVVLARHTMLRHRENNCDNSKKCNEKRTHDKAAKKSVWEAIVKETKLITACQEMVILLPVPMHS